MTDEEVRGLRTGVRYLSRSQVDCKPFYEISSRAAHFRFRQDWGWFAKPFVHKGVLVTWASKLAEMIGAAGDLGPEQVELVAIRLGERLKPAT